MTAITDWRTSSFSGGDNNDCVQVANTLGALRDSKNTNGGVLTTEVRGIVEAVKKDRFHC